MSANITCPVSDIKINENRVRLNAFFVLLSALACILAPNWEVPAFLVIDFFLRGFGLGRYSPLNTLSGWVIRNLSIGNKPIDQAPKLFAAQLGFAFSGLLLIFSVFSVSEAGYSIAAPSSSSPSSNPPSASAPDATSTPSPVNSSPHRTSNNKKYEIHLVRFGQLERLQ